MTIKPTLNLQPMSLDLGIGNNNSNNSINVSNLRDLCNIDRGDTPLHIAVRAGNFTAVRILLEAGVEPDLKNYVGMTPLHLAAYYGSPGMVKWLIAAKVNYNAVDYIYGATPLHVAADCIKLDAMHELLKAGANPNIATSRDITKPVVITASHSNTNKLNAPSTIAENPNASCHGQNAASSNHGLEMRENPSSEVKQPSYSRFRSCQIL